MTTARTLPLPATPPRPRATYHVGDRVSALVELDGEHRRLVGDVVETSYWTFRVRWLDQHGVAVYTHSHEPDHLRRATAADEQAALTRHTRHTAARELARMADMHPHWPAEIRRALRHRAAQMAGETR